MTLSIGDLEVQLDASKLQLFWVGLTENHADGEKGTVGGEQQMQSQKG